jgi:hypothetical protein
MNQNFVGSIYGGSSIKIAHFILIRSQTWLSQTILVFTKFCLIWTSGFRGEDILETTNQKQELPLVAMFINGSV